MSEWDGKPDDAKEADDVMNGRKDHLKNDMNNDPGETGTDEEDNLDERLMEMLIRRHSVRQYTGKPIPPEKLNQIILAGLLSESGRGLKPWEFIIVRDRKTLIRLSDFRFSAAKFLVGADTAIVVLGDPNSSDTWVEDCSIAMAHMHLMADSIGIGSCWIQGRMRVAYDGRTSDQYVREVLKYPAHLKLEAILSLGMPAEHAGPTNVEMMPFNKIHINKY